MIIHKNETSKNIIITILIYLLLIFVSIGMFLIFNYLLLSTLLCESDCEWILNKDKIPHLVDFKNKTVLCEVRIRDINCRLLIDWLGDLGTNSWKDYLINRDAGYRLFQKPDNNWLSDLEVWRYSEHLNWSKPE